MLLEMIAITLLNSMVVTSLVCLVFASSELDAELFNGDLLHAKNIIDDIAKNPKMLA